MKLVRALFVLAISSALLALSTQALAQTAVSVQVRNPLATPRWAATVAVDLAQARKLLPALDASKAVVVDGAGKPVLSQLLDLDGDGAAEELIFQSDLGAHQTQSFTLQPGNRKPAPRDQYRVYGRFVRERHDDFAWENDRVAHRVYGPGLANAKKEPLISSGIDVWVKRTSRLVINNWYMVDEYHQGNGEGGDYYSVEDSRGCGGLGIWNGNQLFVSTNFTSSRVLAKGPIRLVFELDYAPWEASGVRVSETRRVTLDAGSRFNRMESRLRLEPDRARISVAVGIAKHAGGVVGADGASGVMSSWEPVSEKAGNVGCAVVLPGGFSERRQTENEWLAVRVASTTLPFVYYMGSAWDRAGDTPDASTWTRRVRSFAEQVALPLAITLKRTAAVQLSVLPENGEHWSTRFADSVIARKPNLLTEKWSYDNGVVLKGLLAVWRKTRDRKYYDYVKRTIDGLLDPDGNIRGYALDAYNIDQINTGKVLFTLFAQAPDRAARERYRRAIELLRTQMRSHPRTRDGGFWHKQIYPHQMWLDGIYMASPFLSQYAATFAEPALFDEVTRQILLIEKRARDPKSGLLHHAWDESKSQRWAHPVTGRSPHFWGRAMGWYAMALVDVLEWMPKTHPGRQRILGVLDRLAASVARVQDPATGVFWQVLDAGGRDKNYREASASAMFVYALSKAVNGGWLDSAKYAQVAARGYQGLVQSFVWLDANGHAHLSHTCKVAGLGGKPYRDGSYEYYTAGTELELDDPKGVGAFILATAEREQETQ